jgi:uncharacterized YigZ family protein
LKPDHYHTIEKNAIAEFKDRGSKFISYAFPISTAEEFKEELAAIKKMHPKASHYCFAYRLGADKNNFRVSDNGEPSGTAGRPILGQIDSRELTNILVIVVRYFGGTLLGVPGLIHAYKIATSLVLDLIPSVHKPILAYYRLQFDYTQMNEILRILKQFNCVNIRQELQLFCEMEVGIPKYDEEITLSKLKDLAGIQLTQMNQ